MNDIFLKNYKYFKNFINMLSNYYKNEEEKLFFKVLSDDFLNDKYGLISKLKNEINASFFKQTILYKIFSNSLDQDKNLKKDLIFPVGINLSQYEAVKNIYKNSFSIIQGPPGTGKTQTIINILFNILLENKNKTVAVVSNNNEAVKNIYDKLKEMKLDFLCTFAGNSDNINKSKNKFLDSWEILKNNYINNIKINSLSEINIAENINLLKDFNELNILKNEEQKQKKEFNNLLYFLQSLNMDISKITYSKKIKKILNENKIQKLKLVKNKIFKKEKISFFQRFFLKISFKIKVKNLNELGQTHLNEWFNYKLAELNLKKTINSIYQLQNKLNDQNYDDIIKNIKKISMNKLNQKIKDRFENIKIKQNLIVELNNKEKIQSLSSYIFNYAPFLLSTITSIGTYSNLSYKTVDYLIIDEASQATFLSCLPAMARARNIIIVGDLKQLKQIDDENFKRIDKKLLESQIQPHNKELLISNNNPINAISSLFGNRVPNVILQEHYRCHPDIINFCNEIYYENKLIPMTYNLYPDNYEAMSVIEVESNSGAIRQNRSWVSESEAHIVSNLLEQENKYNYNDIGVISPYAEQSKKIKNLILSIAKDIEINTVHKFQGRDKKKIIYCITQDKVSNLEFSANSNLVNVAVSRAKDELVVVVNKRICETNKNNDITRLINYINVLYKGKTFFKQTIGVFAALSSSNYEIETQEKKFNGFIGETSEYIFSKILDKLINQIIDIKYIKHYNLKLVVKNQEGFNDREKQFINHPWSHLDFLIFNKISKKPIIAIEVDGQQHNKSIQLWRDKVKDKALEKNGIKIYRIKTISINGEDKIINELKNLIV
ncbi:DNA helicase [Spiroplasma kunkelii CR2-3x]|uniref:DNA helicase n=1 Tax=Spiroplasma kunkelii CR2-3x TaxID=273035 RepID=A0A0K2JHZ2_SPIKU|nr:AAA domain-containing protein [Spiroplasma kunkelii]ALA98215.1 DNA helicase [Spiroplasma kunkelii CR2-3x]